MTTLLVLQELQDTHTHLAAIRKDLTTFPPDLAAVDGDLKAITQYLLEHNRAIEHLEARRHDLMQALGIAQAAAPKKPAAGGRGADGQRAGLIRSLKETEQQLTVLRAEATELTAREQTFREEFTTLHAAFLAEHEHQVLAEKRLASRQTELEQSLSDHELTRFNRLLQRRQGKALATVEEDTCTGCRTKIHTMLLHQIKESGSGFCESCQRYLVSPANP